MRFPSMPTIRVALRQGLDYTAGNGLVQFKFPLPRSAALTFSTDPADLNAVLLLPLLAAPRFFLMRASRRLLLSMQPGATHIWGTTKKERTP